MTDPRTIQAYEANAGQYVIYHHATVPDSLYELLLEYFHASGATADIGAGSGRDTAWLIEQGFPAIGYDATPAMLGAARAGYPHIRFELAALPELSEIPETSFDNVLCSAVLMHLPHAVLDHAVANLARILRPGGRLLLSWRDSTVEEEREADGRLFTTIEPEQLSRLCGSNGLKVLTLDERPDGTRPDVQWHMLVAERGARAHALDESHASR